MLYLGKFGIIDNLIAACDYEFILEEIEKVVRNKTKLLISPIASHTLVKAHYDKKLKKVLDKFDYLVPDSQWVKRAIWFLYGKRLKERVYGPELMNKACQLAEKRGYKIFLYGNKKEVLIKLNKKLKKIYPKINIVGMEESKFKTLTKEEEKDLIKKIEKLTPDIIFVCLGSPKQEIFSYYLSRKLKKNKVIIPVGAAFDFISGIKKQASKWIGDLGFEWLFRLINEPRLWKRYLFFGTLFLFKIISQMMRRLVSEKLFKIFIVPTIIFYLFFNFYNFIYKKVPIRYWDEYGWIGRSYFFQLYLNRDWKNKLWISPYSIDQPKLAEYFYGLMIYPSYLKEKKRRGLDYDMVKYLIDNNFYRVSSKRYEDYKNSNNDYIDWGKDPKRVFDVSEDYLIKNFGFSFKKTINLIYQARSGNVILLSLTIIVVYFLSFLLSDSIFVAFLTSCFYGLNTLIVNASLRAQSEGIFLFLFNLSLLSLVLFFRDKNYSFKIGLLFFFFSALLTATKLNGLMMPLFFLGISFIIFSYNFLFKDLINIKLITVVLAGLILYISIFIFHHPFLIRYPIDGIILLYKHRYETALWQASNVTPQLALWSFKDRFFASFKNFFTAENIKVYNNYFYIREFVNRYAAFLQYFYLTNFLGGLIFFISKKLKKFWFFLFTFLSALFLMGGYLVLNWDRYFVQLIFFIIFFQTYGFQNFLNKIFHKICMRL